MIWIKRISNLEWSEIKAIYWYYTGKPSSCTTFMDEETLSYGYGKMDKIGCWEYQLPFWFTKKF